MFAHGEVVGFRTGLLTGFADHVGIYTERNTVISNSMKRWGVAEESEHEFSGGKPLRSFGYPSNRPAWQVIAEARSRIGEPWGLLTDNCEHFVRSVHGIDQKSPQVRGAVFAALLGVGLGFLLTRA